MRFHGISIDEPGTPRRIEWDLDNDGDTDVTTPTPRLVVPPGILPAGTYVFELKVTDDIGLSSTDTAAVTVAPNNGVSVTVADLDGDGDLDVIGITADDAGRDVQVQWTVDAEGPTIRITNGGAVVAIIDPEDCDDRCDFVLNGGEGDDRFTVTGHLEDGARKPNPVHDWRG